MGFLKKTGGPIKDLRLTQGPYDKRVLHAFWQMARPTQDLMIATPLAMTVVGTTIKERGGEEEGSKGGREREGGWKTGRRRRRNNGWDEGPVDGTWYLGVLTTHLFQNMAEEE